MWNSTSLIVDKSTGRRTRVDAAFQSKAQRLFHGDHMMRQKTVEAMSFTGFPNGLILIRMKRCLMALDQMEYPMMVNDNPVEDHAESIELTDHEIFHTMFPFYMGINETKVRLDG